MGRIEDLVHADLLRLEASRWIFLRIAGAIVGNEAEDVVQDAFVKALVALRKVRPIDLEAWFCVVVRHVAIDRLVRNKNRERLEKECCPFDLEENQASLDDGNHSFPQDLKQWLIGLGPKQRDVWLRVDVRGMRVYEVAADLGMTSDQVSGNLHHARKNLRLALSRSKG